MLVAITVAVAYVALSWRYDQWRGWHKTGTGTETVEWFAAAADFLRDAPFGPSAGLLLNALGWALLCFIVLALARRFRHAA